jgi:hypothetical protein
MAALWCTARACPTQLILHVRAACHADVVHVLHMLLHLPRARYLLRVTRSPPFCCMVPWSYHARCLACAACAAYGPPRRAAMCSQSSVSGPIRSGGRAVVRPCGRAPKQSGSARAAAANQRRTDWHYSTRRTIVLTRVVYSGTDGDLQRPAKCMDVVGVGAVVEPYEFVPAMVYLSVVCSR